MQSDSLKLHVIYLKKTIYLKSNAVWVSELSSVINKYNSSCQISMKMKPIDASEKSIEKEVFINLRDDREKQTPKFKTGQLFEQLILKEFLV